MKEIELAYDEMLTALRNQQIMAAAAAQGRQSLVEDKIARTRAMMEAANGGEVSPNGM